MSEELKLPEPFAISIESCPDDRRGASIVCRLIGKDDGLKKRLFTEEQVRECASAFALQCAPAPSPWVSVEERLPEDGADVAFIVGLKSEWFSGRKLGGTYRTVSGFGIPGVMGLAATHWMPLPPAPAKEDGHE